MSLTQPTCMGLGDSLEGGNSGKIDPVEGGKVEKSRDGRRGGRC